MNETTTVYVGLDVDAKFIFVAMQKPDGSKPVEWRIAHETRAIKKLAKRLLKASDGCGLHVCYEAGPTGYALQRMLQEAGVLCDVIAPSLIPKKPGERVKTDRRDAIKLVEYLKTGHLTVVHPPTEADESVRDLVRAREAGVEDRTRCRHRVGKFLLRQGVRWTIGRRAWTQVHRTWLHGLSFEQPESQLVFDSYMPALAQTEDRVEDLEAALESVAATDPYREPVGWLCCFRGIKTVTAMTIITELHGFERFHSPTQLMSYLGLTPSESTTGGRQHQGSITKAGNAHVRRVLVESAWHYRHKPITGRALRKRREGQPGWAVAIADKAQRRLCKRFAHLAGRGKELNKVTVAVGRELVGFIWVMLSHSKAETA